LLRIVEEADNAEAHRKSAVAALVTIEPKNHVNSLARLLLDDAEKIGVREQIASSLASVNQSEAYTALVQAFEKSPARLQTTIGLGMASSPQGGTRLLDAVAAGKASARLLQDRAIEQRLRQAKIGNLDERLAKLTKGLPPADQKALELIAQRRKGFASAQPDVKQGRLLFEKHCAACHIVANQGSKIGPQLDGIGIRGLERLLEDTLDPSRNVDQAFRATTIELDNGQFVSGLLLREEGKVLVLADNQGKEVRIEGSKVANRTVGQLSPMPANFAEQIMERDFHHLMAYLLEQRAK
jgi:putative heme-binding domain-containing protein